MPNGTITYNTVQDLSVSVNLKFQEGLNGYTPVYNAIAVTISSSGSSNTYPLGATPTLAEWVGPRHVDTIKEYKYTLINKLFSSAIVIPRTAIEDDEYGFYLTQAKGLGQEAKQHPDELLAQLIMDGFTTGICYDGQPFFSETHEGASEDFSNLQKGTGEPWVLLDMSKAMSAFFYQERVPYTIENPSGITDDVFMLDQYKYGVRGRCNAGYGLPQMAFGSQAELTQENFEAAMLKMLQVKKQNGNSAGVMPTHIVVGPQNYAKALALFKTMQQSGTTNVWFDKVEIVLLRFLTVPATPPAQEMVINGDYAVTTDNSTKSNEAPKAPAVNIKALKSAVKVEKQKPVIPAKNKKEPSKEVEKAVTSDVETEEVKSKKLNK